ncbi:MAG TPA: DNA-3-methyladenine glycosylase 2 [Usitatibacter sp.]|nr:DNA-3-methyladenine glycosylase 2 [Usitatibacter sp.]
MLLDADQCYRALCTHDARFDGRFFVGVGSTRIYCRPVCTARTPLKRNCRFFPSAAAAESEGFRPCLRCRPELAPGFSTIDAQRRLAQAAASRIEDGSLADSGLDELASRLGVTSRHLRRVFSEEFGVAPIEYAQTQRLLLAKRLLTDTRMPVIDVAFASGFASLRRFNDAFRARYRMTPGELRRDAGGERPSDRLAFDLAYRPPYDWESMLAFLERRAIPGVEQVHRNAYRRTVRVAGRKAVTGWIEVSPSRRRSALRVLASASLAPAIPPLLARVKHLFDLSSDPAEIDAALGAVAAGHPGLRLPGAVDGFEMAVRAILGQQVTVRAATVIAGRVARAFGEPIATPFDSLTHLFPTPARLAACEAADIASQGVIASRARSIVALARALEAGGLKLECSEPVERTLEALALLPGVGPWTAQYIAMRALAWPDAFPHPDVAVLKALGETRGAKALERAEAWRPWRSYAVLHLWKSLEKKP